MDTLYTSRLVIRPFALDDLEAAHALYDIDLEWSGPGISLDERRERLLFQMALAHWELTGGLYGDRAIVLKESAELIGIVGFRPWICASATRSLYVPAAAEHPFHAPELGVGCALSSRQRGQGYATEAVRALIDYAFEKLKVRRVVALTFRGNDASVAVMRRAGMQVGLNPNPQAAYPWAVGIVENA